MAEEKKTKPCEAGCGGTGSIPVGVDEKGRIIVSPCIPCGGTGEVPA